MSPSHEVVSSCLWRMRDELVLALDDRFGEPVDAYVNGAQVWLRDDGPAGESLEWRLHPVANFVGPSGVTHHDLLASVVFALRAGEPPPLPPASLWDGLEAFPGFGDEIEPARLAAACTESLGLAPDAFGLVDHTGPADEWERSGGQVSIVDLLLAQLRPS